MFDLALFGFKDRWSTVPREDLKFSGFGEFFISRTYRGDRSPWADRGGPTDCRDRWRWNSAPRGVRGVTRPLPWKVLLDVRPKVSEIFVPDLADFKRSPALPALRFFLLGLKRFLNDSSTSRCFRISFYFYLSSILSWSIVRLVGGCRARRSLLRRPDTSMLVSLLNFMDPEPTVEALSIPRDTACSDLPLLSWPALATLLVLLDP